MAPKMRMKDLQAALQAEKDARAMEAVALHDAHKRVQEQEAALARANADLANARTQIAGLALVPRAPAQEPVTLPTIPRPHVPKGKTLAIREEMGVSNKLYQQIRYCVRRCAWGAGLNWKKTFHQQSLEKLANVFQAASEDFKILKRYEADWATAAILGRYMQNVRKYARAKGVLAKMEKYNRKTTGNAPSTSGSATNADELPSDGEEDGNGSDGGSLGLDIDDMEVLD